MSLTIDLIVIGAGSAGLAAAYAAKTAGVGDVLVIERESYSGGVLPQCVHDGFGLHVYGASLTGPEYIARWDKLTRDAGVRFWFDTSVLNVTRDDAANLDYSWQVEVAGAAAGGNTTMRARAVIVATGCRERTRGALNIPGTRPLGVMTAGTAQYMINIQNQLPGDEVVILGSGDIGLIMARRLTLEGAKVRLILGAEGTGLLRNHIRCVQDFNIPYREGWGIASIHGHGQLVGVTVAPYIDSTFEFDMDRAEFIRCNLLLLACGLIPEREVLNTVPNMGQSGIPVQGLFICGNAATPHDLVDQVTQESLLTGVQAASYILNKSASELTDMLPDDISYILKTDIQESKGSMRDFESKPGATAIPCTVCPTSCIVYIKEDGTCVGNTCTRGETYAQSELKCPMRTLTGTVRTDNPSRPLVPVRTSTEIPRDRMLDIAHDINKLSVSLLPNMGDVIVCNIANTDADLIVCA